MSNNDPEIEDLTEPTVLVERKLAKLIRDYLSKPTRHLAQSVVRQLEILLNHPDCIGFPDNRCAYKKMLQQWRAMS